MNALQQQQLEELHQLKALAKSQRASVGEDSAAWDAADAVVKSCLRKIRAIEEQIAHDELLARNPGWQYLRD